MDLKEIGKLRRFLKDHDCLIDFERNLLNKYDGDYSSIFSFCCETHARNIFMYAFGWRLCERRAGEFWSRMNFEWLIFINKYPISCCIDTVFFKPRWVEELKEKNMYDQIDIAKYK